MGPTVTISLEEYDELRNFKKKILSGKKCILEAHHPYGVDLFFHTEESINFKLLESFKSEIIRIKKMSILEFVAWRKS